MAGVTRLGTSGTNVMTPVAFLEEVAFADTTWKSDDPTCKSDGDMVLSASLKHLGEVGKDTSMQLVEVLEEEETSMQLVEVLEEGLACST